MITYWQAIWLALVQGLTEFLPVSSSGHLAIAGMLLGVPAAAVLYAVLFPDDAAAQ